MGQEHRRLTLLNLQPINLQSLNLQSLHLKTLHLNWAPVSFRFHLPKRGLDLKPGLSYLEYIPSTTRAMLSRLGAVVTAEIVGQLVAAHSDAMRL